MNINLQDYIEVKERLRHAQNLFDRRYESFIHHINKAREARKITLEDVARRAKIPKTKLVNVLYSGNKSLTTSEMGRLIEAVS